MSVARFVFWTLRPLFRLTSHSHQSSLFSPHLRLAIHLSLFCSASLFFPSRYQSLHPFSIHHVYMIVIVHLLAQYYSTSGLQELAVLLVCLFVCFLQKTSSLNSLEVHHKATQKRIVRKGLRATNTPCRSVISFIILVCDPSFRWSIKNYFKRKENAFLSQPGVTAEAFQSHLTENERSSSVEMASCL